MNKGPVLGWINRIGAEAPGTVNLTCADETPTSPATHLRQPWPWKRLVTHTNADVTVRFDFGEDVHPVDLLALGLVDAPPTATVEATLYAGLFTNPALTLGPGPAWGEPGPNPNARHLSPRAWTRPILDGAGDLAPVDARSGEITLRGAGDLDRWQLANLWVGTGSHRLSKMPRTAPTFEPVHYNAGDRSPGGYPQPQSPGRTVLRQSHRFTGLAAEDWYALTAAQFVANTTRPVVWVLDPEGVVDGLPPGPHRGFFTLADAFGASLEPRHDPTQRRDFSRVDLLPW